MGRRSFVEMANQSSIELRAKRAPTEADGSPVSAVNTSNHSSNDPGQRGAVALTDHELTEFA